VNTLQIFKDTCIDNILDKIEEIIEEQIRFIILRFNSKLVDAERKKIIETIKKYFDIFVILKTDVPPCKKRIEEYLSYGIHGIFFNETPSKYTEEQIDTMTFAAEIFPYNLVLAGVDDKLSIERLLDKKIIPIAPYGNKDLIKFIKNHRKFRTISSGIIKYIPIVEANQCQYTTIDKIKMKMILEAINFRQKLMVKNVEDSFNSSSL
jgi:hypothetical protein